MSECFIEGSVEVTSFEKLVEALEKQNELMEQQNELLEKIWRRM